MRRERDSNPRRFWRHTLSKACAFDHSATYSRSKQRCRLRRQLLDGNEFPCRRSLNPVDDNLTIAKWIHATLDVLANDGVSIFGVIDSFTQPAFGTVRDFG